MNVVKLQALHCQCQQVWLEDNYPTEGCIVIVNAACLTFVLLYDVSRMQFLEQNAKALYYTQCSRLIEQRSRAITCKEIDHED